MRAPLSLSAAAATMFPGTGPDASAIPGSPRTPRGLGNTSFDTMTEEELSESLVYLTCPICEQVCVWRESREASPLTMRQSTS